MFLAGPDFGTGITSSTYRADDPPFFRSVYDTPTTTTTPPSYNLGQGVLTSYFTMLATLSQMSDVYATRAAL